MPYKVCSYCDQVSYSASDALSEKWDCPYCEKDISHVASTSAQPKKSKKKKEENE